MSAIKGFILGVPLVGGTSLRIKRADQDPNLYYYNLRHDDGSSGDGLTLEKHVLANHFGTVITSEPINYLEDDNADNSKWIDLEGDDLLAVYKVL